MHQSFIADCCSDENYFDGREPVGFGQFEPQSKRSHTHADVVANISSLLAFVKTARRSAKSTVNATRAPILWMVVLIK